MIAGILALTTTAAFAEDFEALLKRAIEARDRRDHVETLRYLREAHALRPLARLKNNMGFVLEELGRFEEAAEMYRQVLDDDSADPKLKTLDRERLAALRPRLSAAWVRVRSDQGGVFHLDGKRIAPSAEIEVEPGPHAIQLFRLETKDVLLIDVAAVVGRRTDLDVRWDSVARAVGVIDLSDIRFAVSRFTVDGQPLYGLDFGTVKRILVPPGQHFVHLEAETFSRTLEVRTSAGRSVSLASMIVPPKAVPIVAKPKARALSPYPWLVAGVAGAAFATSGALFSLAESDRRRFDDTGLNANGEITGLTFVEAQELEASRSTKIDWAQATLGVGAVLAATAIIWWLLE